MARLACKFGVIKYIPNSIKQEIINVGVILHCAREYKVLVKFLDYEPRIKHFVSDIQYAEFRAFRRLLGKHIRELSKAKFVDPLTGIRLDDDLYLENLQEHLKSPFIISKPQFIFSENIYHQIEDLYNNLVLDPEECRVKQKPLIKQVEERFVSAGIDRYIERDIPVKNLPFDLNIEFGYRCEGSLDLLQPISLQDSLRENYKEGVFWKDAIERVQNDEELNAGNFIAIVKPPRNAQKIGFSELLRQFQSVNRTFVVNYNTPEFERLVYSIKHHGHIQKAL